MPTFDLHDFFQGLPVEVRRAFDQCSTWRRLPAGSPVLQAGVRPAALYQLAEGRAKYCSFDYRGRETVTALLKRGDWIGLTEILTGAPAISDVTAQTDVRLRCIGPRDVERLLDAHPVVTRQLLRLFCLRFSVMYHRAQDRSELTLKERLLKLLHALSYSCEEADGAVIRMSQSDLAKMLAASRQTLNRLLKELEREALLEVSYNAVRLVSRSVLEQRYGHILPPEGDSGD